MYDQNSKNDNSELHNDMNNPNMQTDSDSPRNEDWEKQTAFGQAQEQTPDPNGTSASFGEQAHSTERESSYTYVFSNGVPSGAASSATSPREATGKRTSKGFSWWMLLLTVFLCAAVSFAAGFGGTQAALAIAKAQAANDANKVIGAPSEDSLHSDDPESMLAQGISEPSIYGSAGDEVFSVSQVVAMVENAVVVIDVKLQSYGSVSTSSGSGVIIAGEGYILTCNHVVEGAKEITVTLNSGTTYSAAFVGGDAQSDLALLKIAPQETLTYVEHGKSENLVAGETVVAIGNPLGVLGGTVTRGIISSTERTVTMSDGTVMTLIQTDAAINSGNSGGGLFNLDGQLIGIVNAKYKSQEGLAFAIPIDSALSVEKDLIQYGYVRGIVDHGLTTTYIAQMDIFLHQSYYDNLGIKESGVYVISSEFCEALANADRILAINGVEITSVDQLENEIKKYKVGETLTMLASRNGTQFTASLTLQEYIPDHVRNELK